MKSIKRYLKRKNLTQRQFAATVEVAEDHLSRILTGKRGASNQVLLRLADRTGIPLKRLIAENKPDGRAQA